ncbi:XRE family transcriptional regulator [Zongyangia sp. HA2173]|uniref:XRE family transcriptional regulator n=1 Tax=Zongyangia sp. HA2173 TaxID=3133035 RepID=UPI00315E5E68
MYKNKGREGSHNLCGTKVKYYRKRLPGHPSQNAFAKMAQLEGLDIDKNTVQRVVSGQRFVTDIDMKLCLMMNKGRLWPSFFCSALGSCKHS